MLNTFGLVLESNQYIWFGSKDVLNSFGLVYKDLLNTFGSVLRTYSIHLVRFLGPTQYIWFGSKDILNTFGLVLRMYSIHLVWFRRTYSIHLVWFLGHTRYFLFGSDESLIDLVWLRTFDFVSGTVCESLPVVGLGNYNVDGM